MVGLMLPHLTVYLHSITTRLNAAGQLLQVAVAPAVVCLYKPPSSHLFHRLPWLPKASTCPLCSPPPPPAACCRLTFRTWFRVATDRLGLWIKMFALLSSMRTMLGSKWEMRTFSQIPPAVKLHPLKWPSLLTSLTRTARQNSVVACGWTSKELSIGSLRILQTKRFINHWSMPVSLKWVIAESTALSLSGALSSDPPMSTGTTSLFGMHTGTI